ncbi:MAG: hypothetical protein ACI4RF_07195, partial [Eubacterium sp.]
QFDVADSIEINVVGADVNKVKASYEKKYYLLSDLKIEIYHSPFVYAPVKCGDRLGYVYLYCNEKLIERLPIEADEDVKYYAEQERSTLTEVYG